MTAAGVFFHYGVHIIAHRIPPKIVQQEIPQVPKERRTIKRVGQYYTAYEEQFFILFLGPVFAWLVPCLPTYMLYGASFIYAIAILIYKIRLVRKRK